MNRCCFRGRTLLGHALQIAGIGLTTAAAALLALHLSYAEARGQPIPAACPFDDGTGMTPCNVDCIGRANASKYVRISRRFRRLTVKSRPSARAVL